MTKYTDAEILGSQRGVSSNQYADEGTIAHALAAMCLREGKPAAAYIGRLIRAEDYEHAQLSPSTAYRWMRCAGSHTLVARIPFKRRVFSWQVTEEMAAGVQIYLDSIAKYAAGKDLMVEQRLPVDHLTGEKDAFGTGDAILLDFINAEIQAHDLKFGKGVFVSAEDNEQLLSYLSSALRVFDEFAPPGGWKTFRGFIHQPRIYEKPSEDVWTLDELRAFEARVKDAAWQARAIKEKGPGYAKDYLVVGDLQCKFCPAKATCPALAKAAQEVVFAEFPDLSKTAVVPVDAAVASRTAIPADMKRLAALYALVPLAESFFSAVAAELEARMLAGEKAPGLKVVQGRRGDRAWGDVDEAEAALKAMRVKHDQMYNYKVITPTAAEKLVKAKVIGKQQWAKLQPLITQAEGRPTVVPVTDNRPALEIKPAIDSFKALDEPEEA